MTTGESTATEARPRRTADERRERGRRYVAAVIVALVAAFAVLNTDDVKVHWIVATGQTPLIVVIVCALALGIVADRLLVLRRRRNRRSRG